MFCEAKGIGDASAGQSAMEDILRSGNCPLAEEFLALCSVENFVLLPDIGQQFGLNSGGAS